MGAIALSTSTNPALAKPSQGEIALTPPPSAIALPPYPSNAIALHHIHTNAITPLPIYQTRSLSHIHELRYIHQTKLANVEKL